MSELAKRTYEKGWCPDQDAINAAPGTLLRADNLTLDELGVISLRQGSAAIGAALADLDAHSLFTVVRSGTRYRYTGAGDAVYRNAASIASSLDGSGDIHFGSYLGQTFFARGESKSKDDGTTVRNWGIEMTGGQPEAISVVTGDQKVFASWSEDETAEHDVDEDDGNGPDYNQDQDGIDNEAVQLGTNPDSGRAIITQVFPAPLDFTILDSSREASDDDYISFFMFSDNPGAVIKTTLQIDINGGLFSLDWYWKEWLGQGVAGPDGGVVQPGAPVGVETGPVEEGPVEPPMI